MINLENLDLDTDTKEVRADFGGFLEDGFYITCEVDYDEDFIDYKDDDTGCVDYYEYTNFSFWYFKIFNSANEEISFSEKITKEIKQEIENEIINQLED